MIKEELPLDVEFREVKVFGSSALPSLGRVAIKSWSRQERIRRGFRLSGRLLAPIVLCVLPFVVLEPFLFMIWGSLVLGVVFFLAGPILFTKYWGEEVSFFYVEARCPHCQKETRLSPFLHTRFDTEFKVLCPACGESSTAFPEKAA